MKGGTSMSQGMVRNIAAALLSGALLAGCAIGPDRPQAYEQAQQSYKQAQQDPQVQQYAPVALYEAEQLLQRAEQAFENNDDDEGRHLAYLAQQRVEIARAKANEQMATAKVNQLGEERRQVLLEARQQETEQARTEAQRAASRAEQLESELAQFQAQVRQTDRGVVLTLGDVLFGFDKAELTPGSARNLTPLAEFLQEYPDRQVVVEGHTDSIGPEQYNEQLSEQRAQAVRDYLARNGVDPDRVVTRGFGEQYPVASNENPGGRQQNRRVNVVILREGVQPQTNGQPEQ